jgi:hypothetical protein
MVPTDIRLDGVLVTKPVHTYIAYILSDIAPYIFI